MQLKDAGTSNSADAFIQQCAFGTIIVKECARLQAFDALPMTLRALFSLLTSPRPGQGDAWRAVEENNGGERILEY